MKSRPRRRAELPVPASMARPGTALLLVGILLSGCAAGGGSRAEDAGKVSGCYRLQESPETESPGLPWGVELEEVTLEDGWPLVDRFDGVRRARTLAATGQTRDHPFGYWRRTEGDSLEIGHPGGGGMTLELRAEEGGLVGRGRAGGDALRTGEAAGSRPTFPVRAERVSCPGSEAPPSNGGPEP